VRASAGALFGRHVHCARWRTTWARCWAAARNLDELRRTASGEFEIEQAADIAQLESLRRRTGCWTPWCRRQACARFPDVYVDELTVAQIRNGRNFPASPFRSQPASAARQGGDAAGRTGGIGEAVLPNLYHPVVVL